MAVVTFNSAIAAVSKSIRDVIFYRWRGLDCARSRGKNNNPRTEKQQANRKGFGALSREWKKLTPARQKQWNRYAEGKPLSGYNAFMAEISKWRRENPHMQSIPPDFGAPRDGAGVKGKASIAPQAPVNSRYVIPAGAACRFGGAPVSSPLKIRMEPVMA